MTGTRDALLREAATAVELIERNSYVGIDTKAIVRAMYVDLARSALAPTPEAAGLRLLERVVGELHRRGTGNHHDEDWHKCGAELCGEARAALAATLAQPEPGLREAAQAVLNELDIIRADRRGATYPRLMVHIDTHNDLRLALLPTDTEAPPQGGLTG